METIIADYLGATIGIHSPIPYEAFVGALSMLQVVSQGAHQLTWSAGVLQLLVAEWIDFTLCGVI